MTDLPLFASAPLDRDRAFEQDVALLVPIARELLASAELQGQFGIAANDVRTIAESRHVLLASTAQRYLARLGRVVMLRAGFVPVGRGRTPRIGKRGGNDVILWGRRRVA